METQVEIYPYWWIRAISGIIYLAGVLVFIYNLYMTAQKGETLPAAAAQTA
jgi:cytochrome c oxidase cbb3-type subunit 1